MGVGNGSTLFDLAERRFLVLEPQWTVGEILDLLATLEPEYVLIPATGTPASDGTPAFHVYTGIEVEIRLSRVPEEDRLAGVPFPPDDAEPLPVADAYLPAAAAPDYCLAVDEDEIVGVWDADRNRGPWRGGEDSAHRLEVEYEPVVELHQETTLLALLETDDFVGEDSLDLDVPVGSEIEVWIRARRGFAVEGSHSARMRVEAPIRDDRGEDHSPPAAAFRLRATDVGVGRVEVHVLHEARHLGRLVVAPEVVAPKASETSPRAAGRRTRNVTSKRLVEDSEDRPDLSLTILEAGGADRNEIQLEFRFRAKGEDLERFGPFSIHDDPHDDLKSLYHELENARNAEPGVALRVRQTGAHLFRRLLPEPLQHRLWELKDRIDTVEILSDDVVLPWELCLLCGPQDGRMEEAEHFCEAFAITRWWANQKAPRTLPMCNVGVIAPSDSGLPDAELEAGYLLSRHTVDCPATRLPETYADLISAFDRGGYGVLHFTGHGMALTDSGDWASIDLHAGECLRPMDLSGIASNVGLCGPLVFLNACRTGYGGKTFRGIGGWARQFLRIGAGAFVGTLWSVRTRAARLFAETFYQALFDGQAIGHAARHARRTVRDAFPENTTWLAYTVYADPLAKVKMRD